VNTKKYAQTTGFGGKRVFSVFHRLRRVVRHPDVVPVEPDVKPEGVRALGGLKPDHRRRQRRHPGARTFFRMTFKRIIFSKLDIKQTETR
jgi:hypothetical protein